MDASRAQDVALKPERLHFVVSYKRLERGRFRMPRVTSDGRSVEMDATELLMLLDGIDVFVDAHVLDTGTCAEPSTGSQFKKKPRESRGGSTSRSRCDQSCLLAPPDDPEHECGWQGYAKSLEKRLAEVEQQLAQLARHRSEKLPPLERERRRNRDSDERRAEAQCKRKAHAVAKAKLVSETVELKVPDEQRTCPHCKSVELRSVGSGKPSTMVEYVPRYFRRRIFRRETLSCRCRRYIVNAPAPERTTPVSSRI